MKSGIISGTAAAAIVGVANRANLIAVKVLPDEGYVYITFMIKLNYSRLQRLLTVQTRYRL